MHYNHIVFKVFPFLRNILGKYCCFASVLMKRHIPDSDSYCEITEIRVGLIQGFL